MTLESILTYKLLILFLYAYSFFSGETIFLFY